MQVNAYGTDKNLVKGFIWHSLFDQDPACFGLVPIAVPNDCVLWARPSKK